MKIMEHMVANVEFVDVHAGWRCDVCGKENRDGWGDDHVWEFPPNGWVQIKEGGDPLYSGETLVCDGCRQTYSVAR